MSLYVYMFFFVGFNLLDIIKILNLIFYFPHFFSYLIRLKKKINIQGLMFGYATDETEECMPLTVVLAHKINAKIAELRRSGEFWWARPDSKSQVKQQKNIFK